MPKERSCRKHGGDFCLTLAAARTFGQKVMKDLEDSAEKRTGQGRSGGICSAKWGFTGG